MEFRNNRPELNAEQQAAAFCTKNAVVAAGAGSGKTMVLARRFAWLITEKNCRINEILTLTFTQKAAAQMYRRIHSLLGEIASEDRGTAGERARAALDDFIHARIQTIDSYSTALVKQAAPRYGISPDFTIDVERCKTLSLEEAFPFFISHRRHPAVERLYHLNKGPESIASEIFAEAVFNYSSVDGPPCLVAGIEKQFAIVCAEWDKQRKKIVNTLNELAAVISDNKALHPDLPPLMARFINGGVPFPPKEDIHSFFTDLLHVPADDYIKTAESHPIRHSIAGILEFISALCQLNLQKGRQKDNPAKELIYRLRTPIFGEFSSLAVFCMQAGLLLSVMLLLEDLQRRYVNRKRAEGVLTFGDVARLARTILLEQRDIRQNEKESFKAIMIDEFQDNNELQRDLLFLLAEKTELNSSRVPAAEDLCPDKLFFVGDEKQSIYRFRGADVSVFRSLKNELHSGDLSLRINYRSAPLLIGAFNAIFGGSHFDLEGDSPLSENRSVFVPEESAGTALPLYEAVYTPLRAGSVGDGRLNICILDDYDDAAEHTVERTTDRSTMRLEAVENEARFVAERIQRLLAEKNENGKPKYRPGDIAILFRTHSPQHFFETQLRLLNIPYAGEDINGFFYGGPVNDMMSVLRLAAYPLDRAAYAEMLRSPFAGLSLPALAACLAACNREGASGLPFGDEPLPLLSSEDRAKYLNGKNIYTVISAKAQRESISSLISELWYNQGYRYETVWNPVNSVYGEMYDYLFYLAAQADAGSLGLAAFTDSINALRENDDRISNIEIPLERPSAVHLMTVHKSKGLEFPIVFLCCCNKKSRNYSVDKAVYDTGDAGITFTPPLPPAYSAIADIKTNFFVERSRLDEKMKKTAELRRLLYVGMTRAEKELYLTGCLEIAKYEKKNQYDAPAEFSLRLKKYVDGKIAEGGGNLVPGDSILDNDTFFGLCLPALNAHIPAEGLKARPSFFSLEEIPAYTREYIDEYEIRGAVYANNQRGLNRFFETTAFWYRDAEIMQTPGLRDKHRTPTSLRKPAETDETGLSDQLLPGRFAVSKEYSGGDAGDVFDRVDEMLDRYADPDTEDGEKFNSGGFGTIAHICAAALLNGEEAVVPPALAGFLSPAEAGAFLEAGNELAARFIRSPLGEIAKNAAVRKSEFPFRSLLRDSSGNELFINGTIDLLFEDEESVHVVDFKTDNREIPGDHAAQMACYYRAVSDLFAAPARKKCRIWLYYLRSGHAVEMTGRVKNFNLERVLPA
jgi:ATP-dependent helicase/nuclease subunit A